MTPRRISLLAWAAVLLLARLAPAATVPPERAHWAFAPVQSPPVPAGGHPIDAFVRAALAARGLAPNPPATPRELVRRAYFDLIGLPPAPEEVEAFEKDTAPDRFEKLVDRLLAKPQYGERWARHWLDLARFAQSNGYERDAEKPLSWRYRDYVIKAFNDDKPYNRFVEEQIAGDELPDATAESIIATGFQRLGVWDDEPDDGRQAQFDALDDVLSTTGTTFLGLTIGCARCHDHKFDPIAQADYYSLLAFFRGVRPYHNNRDSFDAPGFAPLAPPREVQRWLAEQKSALAPLEAACAAAADPAEKQRLEAEIKKIQERNPFEWTLAVRESGSHPEATHVLLRGDPATPGAEVDPAFPPALGGGKPSCTPAAGSVSSGRRLALARWIASDRNPLTARVFVNRVWQHHFGRGLVKSTSDFGRAGTPPTHPQLLDWLAAEFMKSGWSLKQLHRLIMSSQTYQQSSRAEIDQAQAADPDNSLLWRQNLRRLEAEALRDTVLQIAGNLNPQMGGRGFFPHLDGEVLAGQSRPGLDWEVSSPAEKSRRSIYAFVRRTMAIPILENFDYNNCTSPLAERTTTTVAPQALMLLNDDFLQQQAQTLAERLRREAGDDPARQVRRAYQLALDRPPQAEELKVALAFLDRQRASLAELTTRLTFRPDVPTALSTDFYNRMRPEDFLIGPRTGWSYQRGFWGPPYEGIRAGDRARAPFALWQEASFRDGRVEAKLLLPAASEYAALLFRAAAHEDQLRGYVIVFDVRRQRLLLQRHDPETVTLSETAATIPSGRAWPVKVECQEATVRVWLADAATPILSFTDPHPFLNEGRVGIQTWGGPVSVDDLQLWPRAAQAVAVPGSNPDPGEGALRAFCLLVLNLNEVVYVD